VGVESPIQAFRRLHTIFKSLKIPHALIGGWAAVAWGVVRATRDIDLLADIAKAIRPPLEKALQEADFESEWRKGGLDDPIPELLRLSHTGPWNDIGTPIDVIIASRRFEREALERAAAVNFAGWKAPVLVPEDIIAMKLSAGGPLDIQDAKMLLEIHKGRLDENLLCDSCALLRVTRLLRQFRS